MRAYGFELEGAQGPIGVSVEIDDVHAAGSLANLEMRDFDVEQEQMLTFMTGQTSDALLLWRIQNGVEPPPEDWNESDMLWHVATGYKSSQRSEAFRVIVMLMLPPNRRATAIGITCSSAYRLAIRPTESMLAILIDSLVDQDAVVSLFTRRDCSFPFGVFFGSYKKLDSTHQAVVVKSMRMGSFDIHDWQKVADISDDYVKRALVLELAKSPFKFDYAYIPPSEVQTQRVALDITETIEDESLRAEALVDIIIHIIGWHRKPRIAERLGNLLLALNREILYEHRDPILSHSDIFPPQTAGKLLTLLRYRQP